MTVRQLRFEGRIEMMMPKEDIYYQETEADLKKWQALVEKFEKEIVSLLSD